MSRYLIFLAIGCLSASFKLLHPIHLSISEVHYSEKEKALQITHKIFFDDLEVHIERMQQSAGNELNLRLGTDREHERAEEYIRQYVQKNFTITVDGKVYNGNFLGKEYETDALWIYVEVPKVKRPKQLEVSDRFLMELYDDQNNFVHFNIANQKKSLRFYKGNERQQVVF